MKQPFDNFSKRYDEWFERTKGRRIFEAELKCLQYICPPVQGRWIEAGVGTGRFAAGMGISEGIDPSSAMLEIAASRGIKTYQGYAEDMPFSVQEFDGIMLAFTLCFIESPKKALAECWRLIRPEGKLLIGIISSDNPWGRQYKKKKSEGHPIYKYASFLPLADTIELTKQARFELEKSACTLFWEPDEICEGEIEIRNGTSQDAGFTAMLFNKPAKSS
ncbi:class I SAM-dependent methyltransferase [Sedimentisphaera salicampi]|uniref:Ubiquinone/menaquinone biosynthesis methyltransferase n=1 Tax=Sedimentisphaera salicampi TaxID=1941349 RepID=A0A1W6LNE6_9BACT|nr:class I SAM-dependent methyltransferase [Sedimentisphaera salicampi]ARN57297.1 ubiquinone/menaquinone biosynthesis methyltransferase [Sedimentisphaera salicampi]